MIAEVNCGDPEFGIFVNISSMNGSRYADVVEYECNYGFELLSGNLTRHCLSTRLWSGGTPNCIREYHLNNFRHNCW